MKRILAIVLLALLMLTAAGCGKKGQAEETAPAVAVAVTNEITALTYGSTDVTLRLAKEDDTWVWVDDPTFPLDQDSVTAILDQLNDPAAFTSVDATQDVSAYGLDKETHFLTAVSGEESQTIYFGVQGPDNTYYARSDAAEGVFLAPAVLLELLDVSIYDRAILPTLPELNEQNLVSLTLSWGGEARQHYVWDGSSWRIGGKDTVVSLAGVNDALSCWRLAQCMDYRPSQGAAAVCGLEGGLTVLVRYKADGDATEDFTLVVGGEAVGGSGHYVTAGDSDTIYRMENTYLNALLAIPKPEAEQPAA